MTVTRRDDQPVDLLSRLDDLRAALLSMRPHPNLMAAPPKPLSRDEIDLHLATVDDACEALQS